MTDWSTERLRALDREVAEARGQVVAFDMPDGSDGLAYPWIYVAGDKEPLPPVSLGTRETFELMEEERIGVGYMLHHEEWWADTPAISFYTKAPTPAVAVCLAYLASKGRTFNG